MNAHLGLACFVFVNEAVWGGDKKRAGAYKTIFADNFRSTERKFLDMMTTPNFCKGYIASNSDWAAPVEMGDRRHYVLDVSPVRIHDKQYFKDLIHELRNGGREALLDDLLQIEVDFDALRRPPTQKSVARSTMMAKSMEPWEQFIFDVLQAAEITGPDRSYPFNAPMSKGEFHECFMHFCRTHNLPHVHDTMATLMRAIKTKMPSLVDQSRKDLGDGKKGPRLIQIPGTLEAPASGLNGPLGLNSSGRRKSTNRSSKLSKTKVSLGARATLAQRESS